MEISPHLALTSGAVGQTAGRDTPQKVQKAAREFEAMLIGQMLKSVRESSFGGGWGTGDQAGGVTLEMAEQQLSQMLASNGGLGLAQLITKGLAKPPNESRG